MLAVDKLAVGYDGIQVIWGVDFVVEPRSITAILGSNGAGKSTVLNTIAGLLEPTCGSIVFEGKDVVDWGPAERVDAGIALVPERGRVFPTMTVEENLEIGAYAKRARPMMRDSMAWIMDLFPILAERRKQMAGTLSGGERQMLAIGRALMSKPSLLMLDEPSVGLAPRVTIEVFRLLRQINETGVTVLLLEQNVEQTLDIATRGFVLETGRMVMEGTGAELRDNEYVCAAYLGM